jgi:hypothetical protein
MLTRPDTPMDDDGWGDVKADLRRLDMRISGGGQDTNNEKPQNVCQANEDDGYGGTGGAGGEVASNWIQNVSGPINFSYDSRPSQINNTLVYNPITNKMEFSTVNVTVTGIVLPIILSGVDVQALGGVSVGGYVCCDSGTWGPYQYDITGSDWTGSGCTLGGIVTDVRGGGIGDVAIFGPVDNDVFGWPAFPVGRSLFPVGGSPWVVSTGGVTFCHPVATQITSGTLFITGLKPHYEVINLQCVSGGTAYVIAHL